MIGQAITALVFTMWVAVDVIAYSVVVVWTISAICNAISWRWCKS